MGTRVPSGGLAVAAGEHSLPLDAAWTQEQTEQIPSGTRVELVSPVTSIVTVHAHEDERDGMRALHAHRIQTSVQLRLR